MNDRIKLADALEQLTEQALAEGRIVHRCNLRIEQLEAALKPFAVAHLMDGALAITLHDLRMAYEALKQVSTQQCKHGKGLTDYCEPCGRINGG